MKIVLTEIGKRYRQEWIFKAMDYTFETQNRYGVTGSNGSGKSTFLRLLSAAELSSCGKIEYFKSEGEKIQADQLFEHLCFAAPYIDLPENLSATEVIHFHEKFKPSLALNSSSLLEEIGLEKSRNKMIKDFSSGMKQRLKLGLAITADASFILLDEPCSNLDKDGIALYQMLLDRYGKNKLIIIGSNDNQNELYGVDKILSIHQFKFSTNP